MIRDGSAKINDVKVINETELIEMSSFNSKNIIKLSIGKKKHSLIKKT